MSSFAYYESVISQNNAGDRGEKFVEGVRAVIQTYWALQRAGKLPPLSIDDRDEALDRVMGTLSSALRRYDPNHGTKVATFVGSVMRYAWLRCAHAVASESEQYETGVFNENESSDDLDSAETEDSEALRDELVYASPPLGFGDPQEEAANLEHLDALADLARGDMDAYRSRSGADWQRAHNRRRTLTGKVA